MKDFQHVKKYLIKLVKKTAQAYPFLLPFTFAALVCVGYLLDFSLQSVIRIETLHPLHVVIPPPTSYPLLVDKVNPPITAEAAIVVDADSQVVIYSRNPDLRFSPASTTKIMTALTSFEYFHPNDILEIKDTNVVPVVVGFAKGEKVSFMNLLYGMLIPSGNDAALAISENYPGGEDAFINEMNDNAKRFHLFNTHYGDPVGLTDDATYTTVVDLARLTSIALKNPTFKKIVGMQSVTISTVDGSQYFPLKTTNELLGIDGVTGVKTGYTEGAREVLVTSVVRGNHTFIIVVMRSDDRFADTEALIHTIVDNVTFEPMHL